MEEKKSMAEIIDLFNKKSPSFEDEFFKLDTKSKISISEDIIDHHSTRDMAYFCSQNYKLFYSFIKENISILFGGIYPKKKQNTRSFMSSIGIFKG